MISEFLLVRDTTQERKGFEGYTLGSLFLNGKFFCYTVEDQDRFLENGGTKIKSRTAIPRGQYKMIVTFSNRFQKELPLLISVPGFEGIRIHGGNSAEDSEGCILVGSNRTKFGVSNCAPMVSKIIDIIKQSEESFIIVK